MKRSIMLVIAIASNALAADVVTLDRIAVVVGKTVIKASDIDRDVRVTEFLNRQPLNLSAQTRRQAADRLIDQALIRQEIATGHYRRPAESDAEALEMQFVQDRFGGSAMQCKQSLARYGLTPDQLQAELLWQLTVLRFIDQRFKAGAFVSNQEVNQYVRQHQAELQKQQPGANLNTLRKKGRQILEGERVDQQFTAWLEETRKSAHIEFKQEAFT